MVLIMVLILYAYKKPYKRKQSEITHFMQTSFSMYVCTPITSISKVYYFMCIGIASACLSLQLVHIGLAEAKSGVNLLELVVGAVVGCWDLTWVLSESSLQTLKVPFKVNS